MSNKIRGLSAAIPLVALWLVALWPISASATCQPSTNAGQLRQHFTVESAGQYALWLRTLAPNETNNSVYVQMDDQCATTSTLPTGQSFQWASESEIDPTKHLTFHLTAGEHTLILTGNEPGVGIDLLELVSDASCTPYGSGSNCQTSAISTIVSPRAASPLYAQPVAHHLLLIGSGVVIVANVGLLVLQYIQFARRSPHVLHLESIVVGGGTPIHNAKFGAKLLHFIRYHRLLIFICASIIILTLSIGIVAAAGRSSIFEAENATLTGVRVADNAQASGGKYVVFESSTTPTITSPSAPAKTSSTTSSNSGSATNNSGSAAGGSASGGGSSSGGSNNTSGGTPPSSCGATPNVPGGTDPFGGCWPGSNNTGVPAGTTLSNYTGSCTISTANAVLDSKTFNCDVLVNANNVTVKNSKVNGTITSTNDAYHYEIIDSDVNGSPNGPDQVTVIGGANFKVLRSDIIGGYRSILCGHDCEVRDSYLHGQQTPAGVDWHLSAIRLSQHSTVVHNSLACDKKGDATGGACSANQTGYPDFEPTHDWLMEKNLLVASDSISYCSYGGATSGKGYSNDPTNATNIVYKDNIFQRGVNRKCGEYGPVSAFDTTRTGNQWINNKWDDGTLLTQ